MQYLVKPFPAITVVKNGGGEGQVCALCSSGTSTEPRDR